MFFRATYVKKIDKSKIIYEIFTINWYLLLMLMGLNIQSQSVELENFRIENSNKDRVYFDSNIPISGSDFKGFIISGKTISGVSIQSGQTGGHFFKVTIPFTFWDNSTIRYEGGSNMKGSTGLSIHSFNLMHIKNIIAEPDASGTTYFVSAQGSDSKNGLSESNSFRSITKAASVAKAGDVVYIKAGNYGNEQVVIQNSGTIERPIKFIGYKNSPNDIKSLYYNYAKGRSMDISEMPYLRSGSGGARNRGILIKDKSNIVIKNIQIEGYGRSILADGEISNILLENILTNGAISNYGDGVGIGVYSRPGKNNIRIKNSTSINHGMINFFLIGNHCLIENTRSFADATSDAMDYHVSIRGSDNIVINNMGLRSENTSHGSHGIGIKSAGIRSEYNLIENYTITNSTQAVEARHRGVRYNVYRNVVSNTNGAAKSGGIYARDGASYNIFENCVVTGASGSAVIFTNTVEDDPNTYSAHHNTFVNCIFYNNSGGIHFGHSPAAKSIPAHNNNFINCTFNNIGSYFINSYSENYDNKMINSSITNAKGNYSKGDYQVNIQFENSNLYNVRGSFPKMSGSNISVEPGFENASSGNFRLKSNSLLIDKGRPVNGVSNDHDKNLRPSGKSADIGAFEYQDKTTSSVRADAGADQTICQGEELL